MSIGQLTMNHINAGDLDQYAKDEKRETRNEKQETFSTITYCQQSISTTVYRTKVFSEGSIIKEINGVVVSTIDDVVESSLAKIVRNWS